VKAQAKVSITNVGVWWKRVGTVCRVGLLHSFSHGKGLS